MPKELEGNREYKNTKRTQRSAQPALLGARDVDNGVQESTKLSDVARQGRNIYENMSSSCLKVLISRSNTDITSANPVAEQAPSTRPSRELSDAVVSPVLIHVILLLLNVSRLLLRHADTKTCKPGTTRRVELIRWVED